MTEPTTPADIERMGGQIRAIMVAYLHNFDIPLHADEPRDDCELCGREAE